MGTLRGKYIPEDVKTPLNTHLTLQTRAAVMSFFRVPLNALVVLVLVKVTRKYFCFIKLLLQVGDLENSTVFIICALWLAIAWALQKWLQMKAVQAQGPIQDE